MSFAPKPVYPTNPELATSGAINNTTLAAFAPFAETYGPPRDLVSNKLATYAHVAVNNVDNYGSLAGGVPAWSPTGCSLATSADRTLRFGPMNRALIWPTGTGWPGGGAPVTKTLAAVFRVNQPPIKSPHFFQLAGVGSGLGCGMLAIRDIPSGNNTGNLWQLSFFNQSTTYTPTAPMLIEPGKWYAAAMTHDETLGTAAVVRDWWLYDFASTTTYHQQQTGLNAGWYQVTPLRFTVGSTSSNGGGFVWGADIDMYCALLDGQVWTTGSAVFAGWVADPIAPARGTYTPSGALTAGQAWVGGTSTTTVDLGATPFRGGTGTVTGQWYRSPSPNMVPGTAPAVAIAGATGLYLQDAPPTTQRTWYYEFQATDSSGTPVTVKYTSPSANNSQIYATLKASGKKVIGLFGDSLTDNGSWIVPDWLSNFTGGSVEGVNAGVQGGSSGITNAASGICPGQYIIGIGGTATGGTFTLSYNGTATATIAYNATASAIQTALAAIPALSGKVTCTGGALPSLVYVALSGGADTSVNDIVVGTNSLTGAAGSQIIPWASCTARKATALLLQRSGTDASLQIGANDLGASTSAFTANVLSWVQYFNNMGVRAILQCCLPRGDGSEAQSYWATQYNSVSIPAVVSTVNDATKCILGDTTAYDQVAGVYNNIYSDLIHPTLTIRRYLHPQAASIAKMWSVPVGYTSAGGSSYTLTDIGTACAAAILSNPTNLLATDSSGRVSANVTQVAGNTATASTGVAFPTTIASTTNITTVGTTTTVTNPVSADVQTIKGQAVTCSGGVTIPAATLASTTNITTVGTVSGNVTGSVASVAGNVAGNVVGSVASVSGNIGGNVTGSVASVTGAVGSVSGNVGGNVVGSVGSVTNPVVLPSIPANWITSGGIAASSLNGKGDWLVAGSYAAPPSASTIATACAAAVLVSPANKMATDSSGYVRLDLTQAVPTTNTTQTTGDALNAARAQGFGKWVLAGNTLSYYAGDGLTVVRAFDLDNAVAPTVRS